jgi:hypothetical protein
LKWINRFIEHSTNQVFYIVVSSRHIHKTTWVIVTHNWIYEWWSWLLSPSSGRDENVWSHISTPQYVSVPWCLNKHSENLTFINTFCVKSIVNAW